ncbi:MAG: hypothetical protein BWY76_00368 [bacterium ADurb.Bin429]|nr:MAG: hypothetical protein BWY76_00368 [bacterium ADurb.Bin429]
MTVHLILDEQSVARFDGVTFHLNPAEKHPENPVLLPGAPHQWDSLQVAWPGTVLYDAEAGLFRCWYSGLDAVQTPERWWRPGHAESADGIHWTKPALGQVTYLDHPTNQLRLDWDNLNMSCVFLNPAADAPPSRRFGALFSEWAPDVGPGWARKGLAWSPDGLAWTRAGGAYLAGVPGNPPETAYQDINQLVFCHDAEDPDHRVVGFGQYYTPRWDGKLVRNIGRVHGPAVAHLRNADPILALAPAEGIDEELHFASVTRIGKSWLMLFESDRFSREPIHGDLRLAVSEDGATFRRVHPHQPLVSTGTKGMWDENLLVTTTSAIQEVGDMLYLFYFGCPNVYTAWPAAYAVSADRRGAMFYPSYLGVAVLPRDRFAYAEGPGHLTSLPLAMREDGLWLNADGEGIAVTAIGTDGAVLATGHLTDERLRTVYRKVRWMTAPPTELCLLQVHLGDGERLYSLSC